VGPSLNFKENGDDSTKFFTSDKEQSTTIEHLAALITCSFLNGCNSLFVSLLLLTGVGIWDLVHVVCPSIYNYGNVMLAGRGM
jgi:hypothetical protein